MNSLDNNCETRTSMIYYSYKYIEKYVNNICLYLTVNSLQNPQVYYYACYFYEF
ncbi:MAG: hypothetical protein QXK51_11520 [Candidatus Methanomethylicia archaeon]